MIPEKIRSCHWSFYINHDEDNFKSLNLVHKLMYKNPSVTFEEVIHKKGSDFWHSHYLLTFDHFVDRAFVRSFLRSIRYNLNSLTVVNNVDSYRSYLYNSCIEVQK